MLLLPPSSRRLAAAALLVASATACARGPRPAPSPAPAPVPIVPPGATVLGPAPAVVPARAAVAPAHAPEATPRTFAHTPGVTWDLDVLPYEGHERVQRYVALYTGSARGRFTEWLSRGTRYDALVRGRLRAGGLPEDLTYLALVESGYDVHAVSRVGAVGMWQFMPETARDVGLRVDWWVDERRDPVRATDAAVRMMRWLRGQFGSLFVAAAAYNGGPGRVSRGMAQLAANDAANEAAAVALAALDTAAVDAPAAPAAARATGDARFFALAGAGILPSETVNYVPQLIAAALVGKEAARHGLRVRPVAPLAYDDVRVPALTPLAAVARATGASRAELLDLNPHLLRGMTPPGAAAVVRVPEGQGDSAASQLEALDADARRPFRRLATRRREAYTALAGRAGVSVGLLRAYNPRLETVARGKFKGRLVSGQAVRVPTAAVLAYARSVATQGSGPGALPPLPAPPPEAASKPRAKAAKTARKTPAPAATANDAAAAKAGTPEDANAAPKATAGAKRAALSNAASRTSSKADDVPLAATPAARAGAGGRRNAPANAPGRRARGAEKPAARAPRASAPSAPRASRPRARPESPSRDRRS